MIEQKEGITCCLKIQRQQRLDFYKVCDLNVLEATFFILNFNL
jgi:hypothetical protein